MATEKRVNYTEAQTADLIERYQAGESVESLAESLGKAVRSVRSKLVREGVYVAAEKPVKAKREEGPTKKELLRDLEAIAPDLPIDGLMNATKEAISALIAHLGATQVDSESAESDSETVAEMPLDEAA
jgi:hypothetical protein